MMMSFRSILACVTGTCVAAYSTVGQVEHNALAVAHGAASVTNTTKVDRAVDFGDLTCMRFTGGSCSVFSCKAERGDTVCEGGRCMCQRGCANAEGVCEHAQGKWLGEFSIMFKKPYDQSNPYIGVGEGGDALFSGVKKNSAALKAVAYSQPAWKIAMTTTNRIRFESTVMPGHVIQMYNNRRRRTNNFLLQKSTNASHAAVEKVKDAGDAAELKKQMSGIPDDDDIWPIVAPLTSGVSPLDATFRVRPTHQDGGGMEIWDPQTGHVLASGNKDWYFADHVAQQGIAECSNGIFWTTSCEGRQLLEFHPELPLEATPVVAREYISSLGVLNWWQGIIVFLLWCACMGACVVCQAAMSPH